MDCVSVRRQQLGHGDDSVIAIEGLDMDTVESCNLMSAASQILQTPVLPRSGASRLLNKRLPCGWPTSTLQPKSAATSVP